MKPSSDQALAGLPHGHTFRFIDAITHLEPGVTASGTYLVRGDENFLEGHFPGNPLMPGVILVEAVAQAAGIAIQGGDDSTKGLLLTAIRGAKITGSAVPGETLEISATLEGSLGNLYQCSGNVRCGERLLLETKVTLSAQPS